MVTFDGFMPEETTRRVESVLGDAALQAEMVERNYRSGERHYAYGTLRKHLIALLDECSEDPAV